MENKMPVCSGCGRRELHKSCPAWGTPLYGSGKVFTAEDEVTYRDVRRAAMEKSYKEVEERIKEDPNYSPMGLD